MKQCLHIGKAMSPLNCRLGFALQKQVNDGILRKFCTETALSRSSCNYTPLKVILIFVDMSQEIDEIRNFIKSLREMIICWELKVTSLQGHFPDKRFDEMPNSVISLRQIKIYDQSGHLKLEKKGIPFLPDRLSFNHLEAHNEKKSVIKQSFSA
ncbi:hypothetical protein TNCV_2448421 [Trichonephila clavipes]|uniref:Uncharacterized protein n=1 Tax=Trichonephila clavipes TaxID=2585209 RepID=A0A8X6SQK2_TRICX|nr:hypothetical protein TNCV_2448421 [Trichonephila clavipes]